MGKNKVFISWILVTVLIFGMMFSGCATTQYDVGINNVANVRYIYIRNAGTTDWEICGQTINKQNYSDTVDIRVIDTNGVAYSKYNVPFSNTDFTLTNKTSTPNIYAMGILGIGLIAAAVFLMPERETSQQQIYAGGR